MRADIVLEGEPREIGEALRYLVDKTGFKITVRRPTSGGAPPASAPSGQFDEDIMEEPHETGRVFMDLNEMRKMLRSKPLNKQQIDLLNVLYEAKGWVTAAELQEKLGISIRAFPGFMGGFGLRVTKGKFLDKTKAPIFFDLMKVQGVTHYRLPGRAKQAMRLEGVVKDRGKSRLVGE